MKLEEGVKAALPSDEGKVAVQAKSRGRARPRTPCVRPGSERVGGVLH